MLIRFITVILFLYSVSSYAGNDLEHNKLIFKVAPLNFVDKFSFQTAQIGCEIRPFLKYSIDFSFGPVFGKEAYNNLPGSGFKTRFELRSYNLFFRKETSEPYFSLEGFYYKMDYAAVAMFENMDDSTFYEDSYHIHKNVWGINIKYGTTINISRKFILEYYGGLGVRIKDVVHNDRSRPQDKFDSNAARGEAIRDEPGHYAKGNVVLGFKIGYVLN